MLRDNLRDNHVTVVGSLKEPPMLVAEYNGVSYYDGMMLVPRLRGGYDEVPITTNEAQARAIEQWYFIHSGAEVVVEGRIVSRGNTLRRNTLIEYPMAIHVETMEFNRNHSAKPTNDVEIKGYICENPIFRVTPTDKEICELTVAVPKDPRSGGAQNYIKCIAWNGTARFASRLYIGAFVEGLGRFQSRQYKKTLDGGRTVNRTTYEVSLYVMADGRV